MVRCAVVLRTACQCEDPSRGRRPRAQLEDSRSTSSWNQNRRSFSVWIVASAGVVRRLAVALLGSG